MPENTLLKRLEEKNNEKNMKKEKELGWSDIMEKIMNLKPSELYKNCVYVTGSDTNKLEDDIHNIFEKYPSTLAIKIVCQNALCDIMTLLKQFNISSNITNYVKIKSGEDETKTISVYVFRPYFQTKYKKNCNALKCFNEINENIEMLESVILFNQKRYERETKEVTQATLNNYLHDVYGRIKEMILSINKVISDVTTYTKGLFRYASPNYNENSNNSVIILSFSSVNKNIEEITDKCIDLDTMKYFSWDGQSISDSFVKDFIAGGLLQNGFEISVNDFGEIYEIIYRNERD